MPVVAAFMVVVVDGVETRVTTVFGTDGCYLSSHEPDVGCEPVSDRTLGRRLKISLANGMTDFARTNTSPRGSNETAIRLANGYVYVLRA
jgi:hypothetical protein